LFATGIVLFVISLGLNEIAGRVRGRSRASVVVAADAPADAEAAAEARAELLGAPAMRPRMMKPSL